MVHPEHVVDAILQLEVSTDAQDLVDHLTDLLAQFGIKGLWLASTTQLGSDDTIVSKHAGMPTAYLHLYVARRYDLVSPILAAIQSGEDVAIWNQIRCAGASVSERLARQCIEESRDAGLRYGITIPIRNGTGLAGWISVAFNSGSPDPETIRYISVIAIAAYQRWLSLTKGENQLSLSPRETEVINWAAEGKTAQDTADILGLSTRTVQAHLENSMTKLDATNKTHAVVKAIRRRIIR